MSNEETIKVQQELIDILYSQVMDLSMMSKIELGDDVIAEIKRLKDLLRKNKLDKLIEQGAELARRHEEIRNEILNDPNLPQNMKDAIIGLGDAIIPTLNIIDPNKKIKHINPDTYEIEYE